MKTLYSEFYYFIVYYYLVLGVIKETGGTVARDMRLSKGSTREDGRRQRKLLEMFGKRVGFGD